MRVAGFEELGWMGTAKGLYRRIADNAVTERAAQLSYYSLFSLFPFLFFLVTLTAYLPLRDATEDMLARLAEIMPNQAMGIVREQIDRLLGVQRPHLLTLGLLVALWSASRAVDALRSALNLAYDVKESRPFWKTQGMALGITILTSILVLVALAALASGGEVGEWLANRIGIGRIYAVVWSWLRWPITALLIIFVAALLYYFLPDAEQEWSFITPGSVVGTLAWLGITFGFTKYVDLFGKYDVTYGSLGGVVVLLTWLYLSALAFIVGGELNALLEHAAHEGKAPGARAAGEAPTPAGDRPSAASPGASKRRDAAIRSHFRFLRRSKQERAPKGEPPPKELT